MLFNWFDTNEAARIGVELADNLLAELARNNNKNLKKEMANRTKIMQKVLVQVDQYRQKSNPNFYKKSKLANEFRWRLLESGHAKDFVAILTKELVLHMK